MKALIIASLLLCIQNFTIAQNHYDVVIDEIMADPSPQVGLPANEWLELKNISVNAINLAGWRIGDLSGQSGNIPNFILQPDSFVIICSASAVAAMSAFGAAISVTSFPSLDNDADQIFLKSANGKSIHCVSYSESWYKNELKRQGGWSMEMIDPTSPCAGVENWKASVNPAGGSPGKKNSVDAVNADHSPPKLKYAFTTDSVTIVVVFDEPVDSLKAATASNYQLDGVSVFNSGITIPPLFNEARLNLNSPLLAGKIYMITARPISDCSNNQIGADNTVKAGLPVDPRLSDIIINEILFNPRPNANDYVELYNRSDKIFDLSRISIANRNSSGVISSIKNISAKPIYIFPGDYVVITEDLQNLELNYLVKNPDVVFGLSLPSFPDDEGVVVLLNTQGGIIDELEYNENWHFKLLQDREGVSLERIDPNSITQTAGNWHSAASTAGYGTPGYKNSQNTSNQIATGSLTLSSKVFSPDNDGLEDFLLINCKSAEPGFAANVFIFDLRGRLMRYLVKNEIMGMENSWTWDGLGDNQNKLPVGIYIIEAEFFNLQGKKQRFREAVALARKFN